MVIWSGWLIDEQEIPWKIKTILYDETYEPCNFRPLLVGGFNPSEE